MTDRPTSLINFTRYHQDHSLEHVSLESNTGDDVRGYHCTICLKTWLTRPKKGTCLGVPNYQIRKERPSHLFTRKELARKHLKPGSKADGYVLIKNSPYWIFLYSKDQAIPETE